VMFEFTVKIVIPKCLKYLQEALMVSWVTVHNNKAICSATLPIPLKELLPSFIIQIAKAHIFGPIITMTAFIVEKSRSS